MGSKRPGGSAQQFDTNIDITINNNQTVHAKGKGFSPLLGAGTTYGLNPHWAIGLAVNAFKLNDSVFTFGGVISYRP